MDFNKSLEDTPETINKDPYEEGWIVKIKLDSTDELDELLDFSAYNEFTESEI